MKQDDDETSTQLPSDAGSTQSTASRAATDNGLDFPDEPGELEFAIEDEKDYEMADEAYLSRNLLDDDYDHEADTAIRQAVPDIVTGEAGRELLLGPRIGGDEHAALANVRWTQASGLPVALDAVEGSSLRVLLPEVFVEEELVFEVELTRRGVPYRQEITVRIQPFGRIDQKVVDEHESTEATEAPAVGHGSGGGSLGRLLGSMWARLGNRRDPRSS